MRKALPFIFAAFTMLSMISCKKEPHGRKEPKSVVLNVTIDAGTTYQLDLSQYGDADDLATISKQAAEYQVSSIDQAPQGNFVYSFLRNGTPKTGGNGTDQVILKVYEPTTGRCRDDDKTTITINFTIQ